MIRGINKLAAAALAVTAISASAGTVGSLTWDGTSDYITGSEDTSVAYLQFGLLLGKTYADAQTYLSTYFPSFHIASFSEAQGFANQLVSSGNPFPGYGYVAEPGFTFVNDALGDTGSRSWWNDRVWYTNEQTGGFDNVYMDSRGVVSAGVGSSDLTFVNILTRADSSWLAVGPNPTATAPVPEPETYAMMLAGLGVLGAIARRKRA